MTDAQFFALLLLLCLLVAAVCWVAFEIRCVRAGYVERPRPERDARRTDYA